MWSFALTRVGSCWPRPRFGDGYKLSLSCVDDKEATVSRVRSYVTSTVCRGAEETSCMGNCVTYMLPRGAVDVAGLFQVRYCSAATGYMK